MADTEKIEFSIRLPEKMVGQIDEIARREYRSRNLEIQLLLELALKKK